MSYGISDIYIRNALRRNRHHPTTSWQSKKHPYDRRMVLIDYDSIPSKTKAKLPSRADLIDKYNLESREAETLRTSETLLDLHEDHKKLSDYHFYLDHVGDRQKARDLAAAAAWLRLLTHYRAKRDTQKIGFASKGDLQERIISLLAEAAKRRHRHLYGFKITTVRGLDDKVRAWRKALQMVFESPSDGDRIPASQDPESTALLTLIPAYKGNSNAQVIGKPTGSDKDILLPGGINLREWHAGELFKLYCNFGKGNKLDFEEVHRRYARQCAALDKTPVTVRSVRRFLSMDAVQLHAARERNGYMAFDKYLPHVKGQRPKYSLSKGGYDGFSVDFYTKGNFTRRDGSRITNGRLMLTVVAVFDYRSEAITGFDVNLVEDGLMVRNMYRNHLNLMGGRSYIEIESDRFSGNRAKDTVALFEQTCRYVTQPLPNDPEGKAANPKARFVERLIQEVNRLAQSAEGWKGTNITAIDRRRKPNPDYHPNNFIESEAEGIAQVVRLINIYNNVKLKKYGHKSRMEVCKENINPEAPVIAPWRMALILHQNTLVTLRHGAVSIVVNGRTYQYAFPGYEEQVHRMYKGLKVMVCYDEAAMDSVDVFGENDTYLATLRQTTGVQRAKAEATASDSRTMGHHRAIRRQTEENITLKTLEFEASLYEMDIAGLPFEEALSLVKAARNLQSAGLTESLEERFGEELSTTEATTTAAYYHDRLLTGKGLDAPVGNARDLERERREYEDEKFNKNRH